MSRLSLVAKALGCRSPFFFLEKKEKGPWVQKERNLIKVFISCKAEECQSECTVGIPQYSGNREIPCASQGGGNLILEKGIYYTFFYITHSFLNRFV